MSPAPSTSKQDLNEKFRLYERHRLLERVRDWSRIASAALEGFFVEPEELFAELD
jgi:hypothetical protein